MGDADCCLICHQRFEGLLHQRFVLGVEGGSRLVKQQDGRLAKESTCDGYALFLAARDVTALGPHCLLYGETDILIDRRLFVRINGKLHGLQDDFL
jgi:hypothetical protein